MDSSRAMIAAALQNQISFLRDDGLDIPQVVKTEGDVLLGEVFLCPSAGVATLDAVNSQHDPSFNPRS